MRPIFAITLSTLILAGCADGKGYDPIAVQSATVMMQTASQRCEARRATNDLKTYSELEACELAAERAFAKAINLQRMDAFEVYAADMQALAAERDANAVTVRQVKFRADKIRSEFLADCDCKPRTGRRWNNVYAGDSSNYPSGYGTDLGMGQGNHAMGPGPLNF